MNQIELIEEQLQKLGSKQEKLKTLDIYSIIMN